MGTPPADVCGNSLWQTRASPPAVHSMRACSWVGGGTWKGWIGFEGGHVTWSGGHGGGNAATLLAATCQRALQRSEPQVGRLPVALRTLKQTAGGAEAGQVLAAAAAAADAAAAAWCSGGASEMRVFFGLVFARHSAPLIPPRLVELTVECFAAFRRCG